MFGEWGILDKIDYFKGTSRPPEVIAAMHRGLEKWRSDNPEKYHAIIKKNMSQRGDRSGEFNGSWQGGISKIERNCEHCGNIFYTKQVRIKMGKGRFCSRECYNFHRVGVYAGERHHKWKGGVTPEHKAIRGSFEYRQWRNKVFERDAFQCQKCFAHSCKGSKAFLHPHHVLAFSKHPDRRFDVDNGITLCKACHREHHTGLNKGLM